LSASDGRRFRFVASRVMDPSGPQLFESGRVAAWMMFDLWVGLMVVQSSSVDWSGAPPDLEPPRCTPFSRT